MKRQKNIFSWLRITRLIVVSWIISIGLTLAFITFLQAKVPRFNSLHYTIIILIIFALSTIIGTIIFNILTKNTNRLLAEINTSIEKLADGDFSARLNIAPINKDIDEVVGKFNNMVSELNSLAVLNDDFVSNFSHEFKTPIVSVKGYAELLNESPNLSDEEKQYLKVIIDESNRLSNLSDSVMTISKLDFRNVEENKQEFLLDEELSQCILLFDAQLSRKNIQLECDIERIKIYADKNLTKEIWINLLSNAVKFTPNGGTITLMAKIHSGFAFVTVRDSGKPISKEHIHKIFEKGYRTESARSQTGFGLGLAISKRIVELHGGTIHAETFENHSQFVVKLPMRT